MDYEQRYKEALEKARAFKLKGYIDEECLYDLFPELKESEDERMRKAIIIYLDWLDGRNKDYMPKGEYTIRDMIAWLGKQGEKPLTIDIDKMVSEYSHTKDGDFGLPVNCQIRAYRQGINDALNLSLNIEKQGEQKSDKIEPKFKVGDWLKTSFGNVVRVYSVSDTEYTLLPLYGYHYKESIEDIDFLHHLWTIEDAEDGDVLANGDFIFIYNNRCNLKAYCYYSKKNRFIIEDMGHICHWNMQEVTPATKEQRKRLFRKMKEAGYEWNAEKKELKKIKQKPADNAEPKFKVGDFIVNDYCMGKVIELTDDAYLLDTGQGIPFSCEHNTHLWTIQDAKEGDVLAVDGRPFIYDENANPFVVGGDYGITLYGPFKKCEETVGGWTKYDNDIYPATKEQRDALEKAMHEAGYEWDAEKKEMKKIEQKPAEWSEEDEITRKSCINLVEMYYGDCLKQAEKNRLLDWLKSLRPQNHWKPSEEQLEALNAMILNGSVSYVNQTSILIELYNDLKKL